jgi:hypothetical protein
MSTDTTSPTPGPALLNERSLGGIAVHLLALLPGGVVVAGLAYLLATHDYTRENARNALNWHLTVLAVTAASVVALFLGAEDVSSNGQVIAESPLPSPFDTVLFGIGVLLLVLTAFAWVLSVLFSTIATGKAIFGTAWPYPAAHEFVGGGASSGSTARHTEPALAPLARHVMVAYALLVPAVAGYGAYTIARGTESALLLVASIFAVLILAVAAAAALVTDARGRRARADDWRPRSWRYALLPALAGVVTFLARDATGSLNPAGDAIYAALVGLWLAVLVYLGQASRHPS